MEGTRTLGVVCLRLGVGNGDGLGEEGRASMENEGTGGGEGIGGGVVTPLSLPLKSLMKPLRFLDTDFLGSPEDEDDGSLGRGGILVRSVTDADTRFFIFDVPELVDLVLAHADCAESYTRDDPAVVEPLIAAPPLRERSRACAWASSKEISLMGALLPELSCQPAMPASEAPISRWFPGILLSFDIQGSRHRA